jgi:hypothetical protein
MKSPMETGHRNRLKIDYATAAREAVSSLLAVLTRLLPGGRVEGREYVVLNPRRIDNYPGSFKIRLTGGRAARNQRKPVLRVWRIEPNFAGFFCARCGEKGAAFDRNGSPPDPAKLAMARAEAVERGRTNRAERKRLARWLWLRRYPIGIKGEVYLREARGLDGPLPATLGLALDSILGEGSP